MTGVGLASGVLYLFGSDETFASTVSASMLLIGIALLVIGYRARHQSRH